MRTTAICLMTGLLAACATTVTLGQDEEILTNADVFTLTEAGLSASTIVSVIESSRTNFVTGVAELAGLSRAGVDSAVIEAMVRASGTGPDATPASVSVTQPVQSFMDALVSGGVGPEMIVIPAGSFRMGCVSGQDCLDEEFPVHEVTIPEAFAVTRYEVTFAQWDACVADGGCRGYHPDDEGWGRGIRPVINVSWEDAQAYVAWLSSQTGEQYWLLTEAEWEYVARAGSDTAYSWGDDIGSNRANCNGCGGRRAGQGRTAPVGSFKANAFGVYDMHGNVWEWIEDCWNRSYEGAPSDNSAWLTGDCDKRVLRGGSWPAIPWAVRSALRGWGTVGYQYLDVGFRVARTLAP